MEEQNMKPRYSWHLYQQKVQVQVVSPECGTYGGTLTQYPGRSDYRFEFQQVPGILVRNQIATPYGSLFLTPERPPGWNWGYNSHLRDVFGARIATNKAVSQTMQAVYRELTDFLTENSEAVQLIRAIQYLEMVRNTLQTSARYRRELDVAQYNVREIEEHLQSLMDNVEHLPEGYSQNAEGMVVHD